MFIIFPKPYVMTGIQKEVKVICFIIQSNFDYAQRSHCGFFLVQNWHVSYFLFHYFVFTSYLFLIK